MGEPVWVTGAGQGQFGVGGWGACEVEALDDCQTVCETEVSGSCGQILDCDNVYDEEWDYQMTISCS
jgi:hypothetical protein